MLEFFDALVLKNKSLICRWFSKVTSNKNTEKQNNDEEVILVQGIADYIYGIQNDTKLTNLH